jgi:hypothetical protein
MTLLIILYLAIALIVLAGLVQYAQPLSIWAWLVLLVVSMLRPVSGTLWAIFG